MFEGVEIVRRDQSPSDLGLQDVSSCNQVWAQRTEVGEGPVDDRPRVADVESCEDLTTDCQQNHDFEPGISTGAPAFRY